MKSWIVVALAACGVCTQVAAQESNSGTAGRWQMPYEAGFWRYAAATVGRSAYDLAPCFQPCDKKDKSAFKIAAGGRFNGTLGVEIGYVDLGEVSTAALQGRARARGVDLSVVAAAPIFDRMGVDARIGGVYGWTRSRLRVASNSCILGTGPDIGCNLSQSDRGFGLSYGAGLSARVTPRVELRLDWDRYRFPFANDRFFESVAGKRDVDMWSAGFNVLF